MSIRFDVSGEQVSSAAGLPVITNFTMCFLFNMKVDQTTIFADLTNVTPAVDVPAGMAWYDAGNGDKMTILSSTGGGGTFNEAAFASKPALNTWNFGYLQCSGSGANLFKGGWAGMNDTAFVTAQLTLAAAPTLASLILGNDVFGDPMNGCAYVLKTWNAVLTQNELLQEKMTVRPQRFANLNRWNPMIGSTPTACLTDFSGLGCTLTAAGTLSVEDGAPVAYGA